MKKTRTQELRREAALLFDKNKLIKELRQEAKAVGLSQETAAVVSERAAAKIAEWLEDKEMVTQEDLNRRIAKEVKQYSEDLAYVYENRGKII